MTEKYVFQDRTPERLKALQEAIDPATFRRIKALGLAPGWRCWEVGAGAGSVAFWLSQQVGDGGKVLASDIKTDLLERLSELGNVTVLKHNVDRDDMPCGPFDLIHTRIVLMHGGINRTEVIKKLICALKPGGLLFLEEHDEYGTYALMPENLAFAKAIYFATRVIESNGASLSWARNLPTLLQDAGLVDVQAEIDAPFFRGSSAYARFWGDTVKELRQQIIAHGMRPEDVDLAVAQANDPGRWLSCHAMISSWGRKP